MGRKGPAFADLTPVSPPLELAPITMAILSEGASITFGPGDDDILGTLQNDSIYGGAGNDYIDGNDGFDLIQGDSGDDTIFGSVIFGDDGNDHLHVTYDSSGTDRAFGGVGDDTYYIDRTNRVGINSGNIVIGEAFGQGTDTVITNGGVVDLTFLPNIENHIVTGISNTNVVGNDWNNVITAF